MHKEGEINLNSTRIIALSGSSEHQYPPVKLLEYFDLYSKLCIITSIVEKPINLDRLKSLLNN